MARRRYISTVISSDKIVNRLAVEHGDFAALLYTWLIPHAADDGTVTADPEELIYQVLPARRDKSVEDVADALEAMLALGLLERVGADRLGFPLENFYRYQSYIKEANRRKPASGSGEQRDMPSDSEDQRKTPENAVSLPPSPPLPLSPPPRENERESDADAPTRPERKKPEYPQESEEYRLSQLLARRIIENNPKAKQTTEAVLQRWSNSVRLMMQQDHRTLEDIEGVLEWSQQDRFWFAVILSMDGLREKFDKVLASKLRDQKQGPRANSNGVVSHNPFERNGLAWEDMTERERAAYRQRQEMHA